MRHKMSDSTCRELIDRRIREYQSGSRDERREMLNEVVDLTGYSVKHAIKVLNHGFPPASDQRRGRKAKYGNEVKRPLIQLWAASDRLCSKRLAAVLGDLVESLERHGHLCVSDDVRSLLVSMSASTVDRLLSQERLQRPRGLGTTRHGGSLKKRIPVRTHNGPLREAPGYFECDLVAHCGQSIKGSFLYTLVMTDLYTGWTDFEPIADRTAECVVAAIKLIRSRLPMPLLGLDTDNGAEFINDIVCDYCIEAQIYQERSRPYKKNDQAHIEQKNGSVVRRSVAYGRYDGAAAQEALRDVYAALRLHVNYFQPSMKLEHKTRSGDRTSRKHDVARTPLQRLMSSGTLDQYECAQALVIYKRLDPLALIRRLETARGRLQAWVCTDPPAQIERKSIPSPATRKNSSSAAFAYVWKDVEKVFESKPQVCIQHLFAGLQKKYPGLLKDQQIHMFRKYVHAWQSTNRPTNEPARPEDGGACARTRALANKKAAR